MATATLAEIKDRLQRIETELHEVLASAQELAAVTPPEQHFQWSRDCGAN